MMEVSPFPCCYQRSSILFRKPLASFSTAAGIAACDAAEAVSTSRRALRGSKVPEEEFKTLPNGLKYYDLKVGGGPEAVKGSRVAPYGFDVGESERGNVLKGLDLGVLGMRVGGQYLKETMVNAASADSSSGAGIWKERSSGNSSKCNHRGKKFYNPISLTMLKAIELTDLPLELQMDVELLSIKQSPFGSPVKIVEG
ncbi:unnamed protein product [Linum tenue]|uniref:peptidylprolyl isomerase n=1 Tax=Linum tenue TaxID=586396 RepID=A0AAV0JCD9_9ROSI|nr:unnamed protein product [Linum tenue]